MPRISNRAEKRLCITLGSASVPGFFSPILHDRPVSLKYSIRLTSCFFRIASGPCFSRLLETRYVKQLCDVVNIIVARLSGREITPLGLGSNAGLQCTLDHVTRYIIGSGIPSGTQQSLSILQAFERQASKVLAIHRPESEYQTPTSFTAYNSAITASISSGLT